MPLYKILAQIFSLNIRGLNSRRDAQWVIAPCTRPVRGAITAPVTRVANGYGKKQVDKHTNHYDDPRGKREESLPIAGT